MSHRIVVDCFILIDRWCRFKNQFSFSSSTLTNYFHFLLPFPLLCLVILFIIQSVGNNTKQHRTHRMKAENFRPVIEWMNEWMNVFVWVCAWPWSHSFSFSLTHSHKLQSKPYFILCYFIHYISIFLFTFTFHSNDGGFNFSIFSLIFRSLLFFYLHVMDIVRRVYTSCQPNPMNMKIIKYRTKVLDQTK